MPDEHYSFLHRIVQVLYRYGLPDFKLIEKESPVFVII
jgi:hypothetical protein